MTVELKKVSHVLHCQWCEGDKFHVDANLIEDAEQFTGKSVMLSCSACQYRYRLELGPAPKVDRVQSVG